MTTTTMTDHVGETVSVRILRSPEGERIHRYDWTTGTLQQVDEEAEDALVVEDGTLESLNVKLVDVLLIDLDGHNYRLTEIGPWKMSFCCGSSAKGTESGIVCRACYGDFDPWDGEARLPGTE